MPSIEISYSCANIPFCFHGELVVISLGFHYSVLAIQGQVLVWPTDNTFTWFFQYVYVVMAHGAKRSSVLPVTKRHPQIGVESETTDAYLDDRSNARIGLSRPPTVT